MRTDSPHCVEKNGSAQRDVDGQRGQHSLHHDAIADAGCRGPCRPPDLCARELITVPILSDEGGLVIPVRVNDRKAAAIVTPRASYTYILKPDGLDLTCGMPVRSVGLTGDEDGYWTDLDMLKLGIAVVHGAPAIVIDRPDLPTLDGRGVIMSIGYDIIGNYATLIDLPGRRLSLFRDRPHGCEDLRGLFTGPTYDAPLPMSPTGQTNIVDVTLNGKIVEMQISTGSNVSIISTRDARRAGVSGQDAASDTQVRTEAGRVRLGYRPTGSRRFPWAATLRAGRSSMSIRASPTTRWASTSSRTSASCSISPASG